MTNHTDFNDDSDYFYEGDARRCPHHPHIKTSSDDGMFDGPCGECEAAMDEAAAQYEWDAKPEAEKAAVLAEVAALAKAKAERDAAADAAWVSANVTGDILF